jgi:sortase B
MPFTDDNTIIYGHNMKNGTMFGTIDAYRSQSYYERYPALYFVTAAHMYQIDLVAGFVTKTGSLSYTQNFANDAAKKKYIASICRRSYFHTSLVHKKMKKLVTFSTCSYEFEHARFVLVGTIHTVKTF